MLDKYSACPSFFNKTNQMYNLFSLPALCNFGYIIIYCGCPSFVKACSLIPFSL